MAAIINNWIDETSWMPRLHSHEAIEGFFAPDLLASRVIFVGTQQEQIIGYLTLRADEPKIAALYIAKAARGSGLGSKLINAAKAHYPDKLELGVYEPNINAQRFYKRHGFVEIPEGRKDITDEGVPELLMRWEPQKT